MLSGQGGGGLFGRLVGTARATAEVTDPDKTVHLPCVFPLPSWLRQCICLVFSTAFVAKTLHLPCVFPLPQRV